MEPEGSLPRSGVPATCPYPDPAQSSPYPHIMFDVIVQWRDIINTDENSDSIKSRTCLDWNGLLALLEVLHCHGVRMFSRTVLLPTWYRGLLGAKPRPNIETGHPLKIPTTSMSEDCYVHDVTGLYDGLF